MTFHLLSSDANADSTSLRSRTSNESVCISVWSESSRRSSSRRSFRRPQRMRLKSLLARTRAVASPIPEVAPVISAVRLVMLLLKEEVNRHGVHRYPLQRLPKNIFSCSEHIKHTA